MSDDILDREFPLPAERLARMMAAMPEVERRCEASRRAVKIADRIAPKPTLAGYRFAHGAEVMFGRLLLLGDWKRRWNAIRKDAYGRIYGKLSKLPDSEFDRRYTPMQRES